MRVSLRRWGRLPDVEVEPGERILASAATSSGEVVAGTRDALYLPGRTPPRLPWEQVQAADWDRDTEQLRVSEVGDFGAERPEHEIALPEPGRLLQLVRERVTASVVVWRRVDVDARRGVRVIGRRPPGDPHGRLAWFYEYDEGVDPADPRIVLAAAEALAALRADVGDA